MSTISSMGSSMNSMSLNATNMSRPSPQQMFNKVDSDKSGTIDKVELSAFATQLKSDTGIEINVDNSLTTYDANGDNALSQDEMDAMMKDSMPVPPSPPPMMGGTQKMEPPNKEEMFSSIDSDSSGTINEDELTTFLEQLKEDTGVELNAADSISTYDTNGDGELSQDEMDTMMQANMPPPPSSSTASSSSSSSSSSTEQAINAYNQNSGKEDLLKILMSMLDNDSSNSLQSSLNIKG